MNIDVENFDINSIPGLREAIRRHVKHINQNMEDRPDGDEWSLNISLKFKRDASTIRAEVKVKAPRPETCSWVSKAVKVGG